MLTAMRELDETHRAAWNLAGPIALDPHSGNFLRRAALFESIQRGMYIYHVRGKAAVAIWAESDQEAIRKANGG